MFLQFSEESTERKQTVRAVTFGQILFVSEMSSIDRDAKLFEYVVFTVND